MIQEKKTKLPIPIPIPSLNPLKPNLSENQAVSLKSQVIRHTAKNNFAEAACQAISALTNSADAISSTGQLDVTRYGRIMKPRQLIAVRGAGITDDGEYYVTSVTHNIKPGEYTQSFSMVRGGTKSSISRVRI